MSICENLWLILFAFTFQIHAQTYTNPGIPGDFPDPSVIRVRDDYYATATTGGWSLHFPILHSKDLINWKIIGAVFSEKPSWAKGDFWAPEIVEDKGRFFVYYTARRDEGKNKAFLLSFANSSIIHFKNLIVISEIGRASKNLSFTCPVSFRNSP